MVKDGTKKISQKQLLDFRDRPTAYSQLSRVLKIILWLAFENVGGSCVFLQVLFISSRISLIFFSSGLPLLLGNDLHQYYHPKFRALEVFSRIFTINSDCFTVAAFDESPCFIRQGI